MQTTGHVDWLACTFDASVPPHYATQIPGYTSKPDIVAKPRNGYQKALKDDVGAIVMYGAHERMGVHVVWSGSALTELRSRGVTDRQLCQHVEHLGGHAARVDVALNLHDAKLTVEDLARAFHDGALKTPARGATEVKAVLQSNHTLYVGNRSSERFLRAYNKAAQLGMADRLWVRFELECKRHKARALHKALCDTPTTRTVVNRAIKDFVRMPQSPELEDALADDNASIEEVPRKLHDTLAWLIEQVAPAIVTFNAEHPGTDALAVLNAQVAALARAADQETE